MVTPPTTPPPNVSGVFYVIKRMRIQGPRLDHHRPRHRVQHLSHHRSHHLGHRLRRSDGGTAARDRKPLAKLCVDYFHPKYPC